MPFTKQSPTIAHCTYTGTGHEKLLAINVVVMDIVYRERKRYKPLRYGIILPIVSPSNHNKYCIHSQNCPGSYRKSCKSSE